MAWLAVLFSRPSTPHVWLVTCSARGSTLSVLEIREGPLPACAPALPAPARSARSDAALVPGLTVSPEEMSRPHSPKPRGRLWTHSRAPSRTVCRRHFHMQMTSVRVTELGAALKTQLSNVDN